MDRAGWHSLQQGSNNVFHQSRCKAKQQVVDEDAELSAAQDLMQHMLKVVANTFSHEVIQKAGISVRMLACHAAFVAYGMARKHPHTDACFLNHLV